ncbi:MAG: TatD family hydrolase [Candidatus Thorarchaeota archaeon]
MGLDHYRVRDHSERESQAYAFGELALFAIENKLPVQIHSRSAGKAALEILYGLDTELVHMHAFDGKSSYAHSASHEYGYYFSIPTSVVRSPQKKKLVKAVDIERLLVETDSPVLGPNKGIRNEPSNILVAVKEIAKILGMEEEELRDILLENTLRLYPNLSSNK